MSRAGNIARAIRTAERLDRDWIRQVPQDQEERRLYTPWMPFSPHAFLGLLLEAVPAAVDAAGDDPRFLEVGCGPGSKMMLARDVCGLDSHGIERVDEYAAAARSLGLDAETADAATWKDYGEYDLIWFNRPFRDPALQAALEQRMWEETRPGTVVMCANLEAPPPSSWIPVLDDWEARRGTWMKPPALLG